MSFVRDSAPEKKADAEANKAEKEDDQGYVLYMQFLFGNPMIMCIIVLAEHLKIFVADSAITEYCPTFTYLSVCLCVHKLYFTLFKPIFF